MDAPYLVHGDSLIYAGNKGYNRKYKLLSISAQTGKSRTIVKKAKLDGKDIVQRLETTDTGYLVGGLNNVDSYDASGKQLYHKSFPAPGLTGLAQVAIFMTAVAMSAAMTAAMPSFSVGSGLGAVTYQPYAFFNPWPAMEARWRATTSGFASYYILTNVKGGSAGSSKETGLVRLNLLDGTTVKRVVLGDKSPDYRIDEFTHRLFYVVPRSFFDDDSDHLICYDF